MAIGGMIIGKSFVTLMVDGKTQTITDGHANYERIREAIKSKDMELVESLISVATAITTWMHGKIKVLNGQVFYNDQVMHGAVVERILSMIAEGFDAAPMLAFLDNLMQNPSKRAVDELYGFLECTSLPITDDGHFLAYKKVRDDYLDFYTGTMDNSVGKTLEMPRNSVDEDKDQTCSTGLHFCSLSYLSQYHGGNGRVVIVKVNPRDVVAIPADYNNSKGRTCRYEVIGEHASECDEAFDKSVWSNKNLEDAEDSYNSSDDVSEYEADTAYDEGWSRGYANAEDGVAYNATQPVYYDNNRSLIRLYQEGYLAGWNEAVQDRELAAKPAPAKPATATPTTTTANPVSGGLAGYNQGRKDAAAMIRYNDNPAAHAIVTNDVEAYKKGYLKGWDSIKLS